MKQEIKFPFYARLALILLAIVLIVFLLYIAQSVLIPLAFAIMVAFLLFPFTAYLERKLHMSRSLSSFVAVTAFVLALAGFMYILVYQILAFSQDIPLLQQRITEWLQNGQQWIAKEYGIDSTQQTAYTNQALNNVVSTVTASLQGIFLGTANILFWIVIMFIYTYFILFHRRLLHNFIKGLFADEYKEKVSCVILETRVVINNYIIGLVIEFVFVAIANCAALMILGIEYAILLGLIAAVLNFIPYLGFVIATALVLFVSLVHHTPIVAVQAGAILFIIHILDANILLPRVVGNKVKMNVLITIISVLMGGALWGIAGMFLSIPITAVLKIVFENVDNLQPWALLMGVEDNKIPQTKEDKHCA